MAGPNICCQRKIGLAYESFMQLLLLCLEDLPTNHGDMSV